MILVIDDFIKDPELLARINADPHWAETKFPATYWDKSNEPTRGLEEYVKAVWMDDAWLAQLLPKDTTGFEYWGWDLDANDPNRPDGIMIHVDYDEAAYQSGDDGAKLTPFLTIFYPEASDDLEGGDVIIFNESEYGCAWDGDETRADEQLGKPISIKCKANRLIIASGKYYHCVSPVTQGRRRSLNVNQWDRPIAFDINQEYTRY